MQQKEIVVLSLFDGMSCAQIALDRCNMPVSHYYASEIDKHAMQVTMANFPNTVQLGSVTEIDVSKLEHIPDLICGGSPCQSFSFAGKRKGMSTKDEIEILTLPQYLELKEAGFEFEGQSYLFWEYVRILTEVRKLNPNVKFLLENVEMGKKWERVINNALGVKGIHINSALVSAQTRKRIYWCNWGLAPKGLFGEMESTIPQPEDKGILLKDILEEDVDEKYFLSKEVVENLLKWQQRNIENGNGFRMNVKDVDEKSSVLTTGSMKSDSTFIKIDRDGKPKANQDKASCFTAGGNSGGNHSDMDLIAIREPIQINPSLESGGKQPYQQNRVYDISGTAPGLCANKSDLLIKIPEATTKGYIEVGPGECFDMEQPNSSTRRGRKMKMKSNTLMAKKNGLYVLR